jgi:hypothetical protein
MSLPAKGICLIQLPITNPSLIGIMWVTPSPESNTVPVKLSFYLFKITIYSKSLFWLSEYKAKTA